MDFCFPAGALENKIIILVIPGINHSCITLIFDDQPCILHLAQLDHSQQDLHVGSQATTFCWPSVSVCVLLSCLLLTTSLNISHAFLPNELSPVSIFSASPIMDSYLCLSPWDECIGYIFLQLLYPCLVKITLQTVLYLVCAEGVMHACQ